MLRKVLSTFVFQIQMVLKNLKSAWNNPLGSKYKMMKKKMHWDGLFFFFFLQFSTQNIDFLLFFSCYLVSLGQRLAIFMSQTAIFVLTLQK